MLRLDPDRAEFRLERVFEGAREGTPLVVCVNGNESPDWRREEDFLGALKRRGYGVAVVDPRGVGALRPGLEVRGYSYDDPLAGVEENLAYNAFLVGESLLGMRVADVLAALAEATPRPRPGQVVLCGRRDAALVACLAAAVEPRVDRLAVQEMWWSFLPLFDPSGRAINAASILPRLLRDFGDLPDILAALAPRRALVAAPLGGAAERRLPSVQVTEGGFTAEPSRLIGWLEKAS